MQGFVKRALAVAAGVVFVRLILEETGAPSWLVSVFGVTWLYLLVPFYFAIKVARSSETRPYVTLAKMSGSFVLVAASMVGVTYSLSSLFGFSAYRFTVEGGGVIGEGITPVQGYIVMPLSNFGLVALIGLVAAAVIGPIVLWMFRRYRALN
ncbi:MAG: hypothetical protein E2P02_08845 [Acidobacteria bacterium]|nr:MAG: hypothetical protein E2P02_08845 [Acidobacteriota bacterium]